MSIQLVDVLLDQLMPDPNQPRQAWVQSEIERLAASIAARGVQQPLRVMWDKERKVWRIITGESRWRAAKLAGLKTVPCLPVEGDLDRNRPAGRSDHRKFIAAMICDHSTWPGRCAKLKKLKGCNSQVLAAELGISGASVTRAEALLTLPEDVQAMVDDGRLAESAAYELSRLKDEDAVRELASMVVGLPHEPRPGA